MRSFSKKKRGSENRRRKPVILIIAEGRNVTESLYFKSFQEQRSDFNIKILRPGHVTDPNGMLQKLLGYWEQYEMDGDNGDKAFIVLDLDCNSEKGKQIRKLECKSNAAQFIVSNPCFEVWFLLHFRYSAKSYRIGNQAVQELRNYIPKYEKNLDVAPLLADKLDTAMNNAAKLTKYYADNVWPSDSCNPRTDVPIIIDAIFNELKR